MNKRLNIFDYILLIGIILMIVFGFSNNLGIYELFVGIFGVIAGIINAKGLKIYLYTYATQSVLYAISCLLSQQYGLAIISGIFCFTLYFISIIKSFINKNKDKSVNLKITKMSKKEYLLLSIGFVIIGLLYYLLLIKLNSKYPLLNAIASMFCVLATYSASKFYLDQWIFWFGYASFSVLIWLLDFTNASNGSLIYLIMNICFIVINIQGSIIWVKRYKLENKITKEMLP